MNSSPWRQLFVRSACLRLTCFQMGAACLGLAIPVLSSTPTDQAFPHFGQVHARVPFMSQAVFAARSCLCVLSDSVARSKESSRFEMGTEVVQYFLGSLLGSLLTD